MAEGNASREICKLCHHVNAVGFQVPDDVWSLVVPEHARNQVVCLSCFTRLGDEKAVPWDRDIRFFPVSLWSHLDSDADLPAPAWANQRPRKGGAS